MTDKELLAIVAEFRDGILGSFPPAYMCFAVSAPLEGYLRFIGVEVEMRQTEFSARSPSHTPTHYWLQLADGRVLDPTADQFNGLGYGEFPPVYLGPPAAIHNTEPPE